MKTISLYFFLFNVVFVFSASTLKSQTTSLSKENWKPMSIQNDKSNTTSGVSFFKKSVECSGKKIVIFKLVNSNSFPVAISWKSGTKLHSLYLNASENIGGSCDNFNSSNLAEPLTIIEDISVSDMDIFSNLSVEERKK